MIPDVSGDRSTSLRADLLRFVGFRERTVRELVTYLRRRGHGARFIEVAVAEAREQGFVDDRRFAEVFLRDRRRLRPVSRRAVLNDLREHGVEIAIAQEALDLSCPPWDDELMAWEAVSRRWERWHPEVRAQKAAGFLQRRGFDRATASTVLARLSGGRSGIDTGSVEDQ
ncbi:MAG: RecX family transcriptional regulator [Candidatus Eisenbacteria sp.]|nr:RecX family transcriptional regulator [Candidatus Eisenbacteria bacterium]